MYLVFVAYYDSIIFSKIICSEGGAFPRIIYIALLFHLQLYKPGWLDLEPKWARLAPNGTYLGLFQVRIKYILARRANPSRDYPEHTYMQNSSAFCLLVKNHYIGSDKVHVRIIAR